MSILKNPTQLKRNLNPYLQIKNKNTTYIKKNKQINPATDR